MLREFAKKLDHPASGILEGRLFTFYTQDVNPSESTMEKLERTALAGVDFRQYYHTLKRLVPELKAVAVRDGDGKPHPPSGSDGDFVIHYWTRYELENYFITPARLAACAAREVGLREGELFAAAASCQANIARAVDESLAEMVFGGDVQQVDEYKKATPALQATLLRNVKMSEFAELFFSRFSKINGSPILFNKGGYYRMIADMDASEVPDEVRQVLDRIVEVFSAEENA